VDAAPVDAPISLEALESLHDRHGGYVAPAPSSAKDAATLNELLKAGKNSGAAARTQAIRDTALSLGVKGGIVWQLDNIRVIINRRARDLDTIYDFGHLMIQDRVVPPVISEARDLYNQDGDLALRLSGAYYKIESQAKFSSVAPNWRQYLTFPRLRIEYSILTHTLKPRNDDERRLWRLAVADGWRQGVEQANLMLKNGMDRMNRDFTGMLRFHSFVLQGRIRMPAVASEQIAVTHRGETMAVDETLLRITDLSDFVTDTRNWTGVITQSPLASPTRTVLVSSGKKPRVIKTHDPDSGTAKIPGKGRDQ
jgi:defect in organelle trafficking lipoprotein dotC